MPEKVPRIARLLALAHKFQGMLDRGEVESMAELARLGRVSRARITQIMDLMMLAPEIQEEVLCGSAAPKLRQLLKVVRLIDWTEQRAALARAGTWTRGCLRNVSGDQAVERGGSMLTRVSWRKVWELGFPAAGNRYSELHDD